MRVRRDKGLGLIDSQRLGYTLIEILIVITILLLLMTVTVYSVNFARDSERISGAANGVQSFLAGARDRAIYGKSPIGVRFFLDSETDPNAASGAYRTISSAAYIDPGQTWTDGNIRLERPDLDGDGVADSTNVTVVAAIGSGWWELKRRGLLVDGMIIEIGEFSSPVSTALIDISPSGPGPSAVERLVLQFPYADPGTTTDTSIEAFDDGGPSTYRLHLPPRILPSEPLLLPDGVVIDLDGSDVPDAWRAIDLDGDGLLSGPGENGGNFMDIIFSPRGNVIGPVASKGIVHLYICDKADSTILKELRVGNTYTGSMSAFSAAVASGYHFVPADEISTAHTWVGDLAEPDDPFVPKERRLVTVFAQTGAMSVHPVNGVDLASPGSPPGPPDGIADNPYLYAEFGEVAN